MKLLIKIILGLVALIALAVVALITLVSPNQFKPHIEKAALEQGVALQMGDLGWAFWPSLGVSLNDIKVASQAQPDKPIAELDSASLMLALMPLLSGQFQVDHVRVEGANIHLAVDKNGRGNWQAFSGKPAEQAAPAEVKAKAELDLQVNHISLSNSALDYRDEQTGQQISLRDVNISLTGVNTQGQPFDTQLSWLLELAQANAAPLQLKGALNQRISLDKDFNNLQLSDGKLALTLNQKGAADIALGYDLAVKDLQGKPSYQGQIHLQPLNLRQLLAALGTELDTANSDALKSVEFRSALAGDNQQLALKDMQLALDKTRFNGDLAVTDLAKAAIKLKLKGDSINVDDYLPPPSAEPAAEQPAAAGEDTPLPLEALRGLNLDANLALDSMRLKKMALQNIELKVKANNGLIQQQLNAKAYQGDIQFNSRTDARGDQAALKFDGGVQGFELAPLMQDLEMSEQLGLSGAIQANTQGTSQGASVNQLLAGMDSTANFSGAQVRLSPLNIEQKFCELVNLLTQNSETVNWDSFTEMRQLNGNIVWRDQVINLQSFNAGVSQLLLTSTGKINLASDKYEFKLPIKLAEASAAASLKGCSLTTTNYWVDRGLSLLRCKGSFGAIDPLKDCGFDKSALGDLTKDFAEYKLREKHGAKIDAAEQKAKEKKQELIDKAGEKIGGEAGKELLGNLLKKKKTSESSSSAASSAAAE